jgi:diguanylate cyclase (GGDEF)-like protein
MNENADLFKLSPIEILTRAQGLPSHQVHDLLIANNKLWLSTPNGLVTYDGERVEQLNQTHRLQSHGIRNLSKHDDYVVVASDKGLDIINSKSLDVTSSISTIELGLGWCQRGCHISDGRYLLACAKGLRVWDSASNEVSKLNTPLDNEYIVSLSSFNKGAVLIQGGESVFWLYDAHQVTEFNADNLFDVGTISKAYQQEQFLWLMSDCYLLKLDTEFCILDKIKLPADKPPIKTVFQLSDHEIIIGDTQQIYSAEVIDGVLTQTKLLNNEVEANAICADDCQNLWVATDFSGLLKYSVLNRYIDSYSFKRNNSVLSLRQCPSDVAGLDKPNQMLVAGTGKSVVLDLENPTQCQELTALANQACWDLQRIEPLGFVAALPKGLGVVTSANLDELTLFTDKTLGAGRCIHQLNDKLLYGSVSGLFLFDFESRSFTSIHPEHNDSVGYVYAMTQENEDSVLVSTLGNGVWRYDINTKSLSVAFSELNLDNVYSIDKSQDNRLLIAGDNSLWLVESEQPTLLWEVEDSVLAWTCMWFSDELVLLGTSQGLKLFNINDKRATFIVDNYPKNRFWEFTTARSLYNSFDKGLWCGVNEGLNHVDIERAVKDIPAPVPEITALDINAEHEVNEGVLSLKQGAWRMRITIGSNWLWQEHSLTYEYRLTGLIANWREISGNQLTLTTLPKGEYILEVKVANNLTQASKTFKLLLIKVKGNYGAFKLIQNVTDLYQRRMQKIQNKRILWNTQHEYNELEKIVMHRTRALTLANKKYEELNEELKKLSIRDQLTGLYNRRYFFERFDAEIKRSMRDSLPITAIIIDIDFFKKYNDNYGHLAGDIALSSVAQALNRKFIRSGELVARYGGEEFIAMLHNSNDEQALELAQSCLAAVQELMIPHEHSDVSEHISISIGISTAIPEYKNNPNSWREFRKLIVEQADKALYQAKAQGRNRAIVFPSAE